MAALIQITAAVKLLNATQIVRLSPNVNTNMSSLMIYVFIFLNIRGKMHAAHTGYVVTGVPCASCSQACFSVTLCFLFEGKTSLQCHSWCATWWSGQPNCSLCNTTWMNWTRRCGAYPRCIIRTISSPSRFISIFQLMARRTVDVALSTTIWMVSHQQLQLNRRIFLRQATTRSQRILPNMRRFKRDGKKLNCWQSWN